MKTTNKICMYTFDRAITKYIKGIAIMLMVAHHLFTSSEMYSTNITAFGKACKICVGIYAFLTGYGYFYSKDKSYKNSLKHIIHLLERYWLQMILIFFH